MDKLPKVFANPIDKKMNNYQDLYYSVRTPKALSKKDVNKKMQEKNKRIYYKKFKMDYIIYLSNWIFSNSRRCI